MLSPLKAYEIWFRCYGPQGWWPADSTEEICVGAILTQNTSWRNVEEAIAALKKRGWLSLKALCEIREEELCEAIRPCGFYRQKARYLKEFAISIERGFKTLDALFEKPLKEARNWLLNRTGIGEETADSILCYAGRHPILVIDNYTLRIGGRLGWWPGEWDKRQYAAAQRLLMDNLPKDATILGEWHALAVAHAKAHCKKKPSCGSCPLLIKGQTHPPSG